MRRFYCPLRLWIERETVLYFALKAAFSGMMIALISEVARRSAALGALIAALPLVSIIAVIWMWRDTSDTARIADHLNATFWYVLPSMPMFLAIPALLRAGVGFWAALALGCLMTVILFAITLVIAPRFGIKL